MNQVKKETVADVTTALKWIVCNLQNRDVSRESH